MNEFLMGFFWGITFSAAVGIGAWLIFGKYHQTAEVEESADAAISPNVSRCNDWNARDARMERWGEHASQEDRL